MDTSKQSPVAEDTKADVQMVKYKLNQLGNHSLPRCPAKKLREAKRLKGVHLQVGHCCSKCQCQHPAGMGTAHLGSGLCCFHESTPNLRPAAAQINANHLRAIQSHHPFAYRDVETWLDETQKEGAAFKDAYALEAEIGLLRSTIQNLIKLAKSGEFTESSREGPVPASDATRFELVRKGAQTVASIAKVKFNMDADQSVSIADLKVWTGALVEATRRVLQLHPDLLIAWGKEVSRLPPPRTKNNTVEVPS